MAGLAFLKMHGLGNDFVVLDGRRAPLALDAQALRALADRRCGIGCDQIVIIDPPRCGGDAALRIFNADGGEAGACGNATRCVARLLMEESGRARARIESPGGDLLDCARMADGCVQADMGAPRFDWREIPLASPQDTRALDLAPAPALAEDLVRLPRPAAANIGNPHCVFFVADVAAIDLARLGPAIEHHPLFPQRVNVGFAQLLAPDRIRLRVWERGAGATRACGTAACAALACAVRLGLGARAAEVELPGGTLVIAWTPEGHLLMSGPAAISFAGTIAPELLPAAAWQAAETGS